MSLILRLDTTAAPAAMASNAANEYTAMLSASPVLTSDTDVSDVKTGDANNMMAYIAAAVLALTAGVAVTGRCKIKNVR